MEITKRLPAMMLMLAGMAGAPLFAQGPPSFAPGQLDQLVQRVALYPDSLLAQTLAGATYADQIPDAARWADQHHYLTGQALANAITGDQLPFDPSVQALLPFPAVLDMMAADINWTHQIGDAFLAQQLDVMDAVQRDRRKARDFGYLRTNGAPYSDKTSVTEYWDLLRDDGTQYLLVKTLVNDPTYLMQYMITSTHMRKQTDATGWSPTPCVSK